MTVQCPNCKVVLKKGQLIKEFHLYYQYKCPRCKHEIVIKKHPERRDW